MPMRQQIDKVLFKKLKNMNTKKMLHIGHEFQCAIGCNEIEGFIQLSYVALK